MINNFNLEQVGANSTLKFEIMKRVFVLLSEIRGSFSYWKKVQQELKSTFLQINSPKIF